MTKQALSKAHTLRVGDFVRFDGKPNSGPPIVGEVSRVTGAVVVVFGEWTGTMQPRYALFEFYGCECIRIEKPEGWQA